MAKNPSAGSLTQAFVSGCSKAFSENTQNQLACNAVTHVDLGKVAMRRKAFESYDHTFSVQVKQEGKATHQKQTGRCWIFAALNVMRLPLMKKYDLEEFEFSQAYLFFWDKLEKANYFLESIIETRKEERTGRLVSWLLTTPLADGGQWHMFVNLVKKYGVVPKSAMQESFQSSHSAKMNAFLTAKLREFAGTLRQMHEEKKSLAQLRKKKQEMMEEVYRILSIFLGEPPKTFDWHFRNKKKKYQHFSQLTPQEFFKKHVPYKIDDKICLIHAPTKDKPFGKLFTVQYLGNIVGGEIIKYVNLKAEDLRRYAIASLKKDEAIWFGCDVGKHFDRDLGVMDMDLFDYEQVFGTRLNQSKEERLNYGQSQMTHAMVLTAVDMKGRSVKKWRVENSWGDRYGDKGYFLMSDAWFGEYLYEIVIDKRFVPQSVRKILKTKPIVLPPWDPMGALA